MPSHHRRPRVHLTAPEGWVNDPLGLTFHGGEYHLFFQHLPGQTEWSPACHWGHATSPDLLHWTHRPAALSPGDGDDGCWSGSVAVRDDGEAFLFYTSVQAADLAIGTVRVARPVDDSWVKWEKGKVVAELPHDVTALVYRDPYVFRDGDLWRMLVGAGVEDGTAAALSYTSTDLENWAYDGVLASRPSAETEPVWLGSVWECPQLFPLGDKHVLTVSVWEPWLPHYEAYAIGTYAGGRFTPETWGRLSYGPSYYAGAAFSDRDGRRGLIYWLRGVEDEESGWASANSVPHLLELKGDRVVAMPHPNLLTLRTGAQRVTSTSAPVTVSTTSDLECRVRPAGPASIHLTSSRGSSVLTLHAAEGALSAVTPTGSWTMPLDDEELRVLLDGPVCEIFASSGVLAVTLSVDDDHLRLAVTGDAEVVAHELAVTR